MKSKTFLRPSIAIVFVFLGAYIARSGTPPEIFAVTGSYFTIIAALAFGTLGFILPDILELAGKAGINVLAREVADRLPNPSASALRSRFRFRRSSKSKKFENPIVLDTSVLIDGRVLEFIESGFASGTFLVIPSVISELQKLADSADDLRRVRGRRGLDVLAQIKKSKKVRLEVLNTEPGNKEVDDKLVSISKKLKAKLMTVDFNLNKVANIHGVKILNINQLTNALRTVVLPGEQLEVVIVEKGKEKGQGVGYLSDGTMVVVENGDKLVGKKEILTVRKVIQTNAGKMMFARKSSQ